MAALSSDVFVGRVRELGELERALDATRGGSGRTVLVVGDAGIGKSRLASELAGRARDAGFEVLIGRSIDLVGTELPYLPFVDALRPLGDPWQVDKTSGGSQLRVFETTLALLTKRAASRPVMLVLEDLHWADTSTLDLVVFLAHNLVDRPVLLLGTSRADELASKERAGRLADGVRRSGSAMVLELGPLEHEELAALLAARTNSVLPAALAKMIAARSEGNPFFAEELLAAASDASGELPRHLRDLLLRRVTRLDRRTQALLRVAAAVGRDVAYPLLCAVAVLPERDVRESLRRSVKHGVLVADPASGSFRFRHALLAEVIYSTILPGEREELHARLAEQLACSAAVAPAELASHWAAAGRTADALAASVEAAREAEEAFGLAEALAHLEQALRLWDAVPGAAELVGVDLAGLCSWAAELASQAGAAPRAVELARRAIDLIERRDALGAARLYERLGRYLHESGRTDAALSAFERVVEFVPAQPPSARRAEALAALAHGMMLAWRFDESLAICERALALARAVEAHAVELRALLDLGRDLAYLGRAEEGLGQLWRGLELAEASGDPLALLYAYVSLTDVLTMLGSPGDSARVGERGLEVVRRYGIDSTVLVANTIEALVATGEWDEADNRSAAALHAITANFPYMLLMLRADIELGRGEFDAARSHLDTALATLREDRGQGIYDVYLAELALWERRWTDADQAVYDGLAMARSRQAAQLRVWFCAKGLRAQAELAALARARRDPDAVGTWRARARTLITIARRAAAEASAVTPNTGGWLALAEAEYQRVRGIAKPEPWMEAAATWDRLERPPLAAYCNWRATEALVAAGASRTEASVPLGEAHTVATRINAKPLTRELELLAQRARLELPPLDAGPADRTPSPGEILGLTPREVDVLTLVARGYTNREIATTLVISVKTASVHVSHILHKLGAPNRLEAAAIAHRLAPAPVGRPGLQAEQSEAAIARVPAQAELGSPGREP
jgi:DNA-binding CsgD family transcriptional regulator/tetratricopeptide (TPR) repeat protein